MSNITLAFEDAHIVTRLDNGSVFIADSQVPDGAASVMVDRDNVLPLVIKLLTLLNPVEIVKVKARVSAINLRNYFKNHVEFEID